MITVYHKNRKKANVYSELLFDFLQKSVDNQTEVRYITLKRTNVWNLCLDIVEVFIVIQKNLSVIKINGYHTDYDREYIRRTRNLRKKRIQEMKQKLAILAVSIAFILLLGCLFGTILSDAKVTESNPKPYKYFTSYTVQYDDTMWEIAQNYMDAEHYASIQDYIKEVERMNHIDADHIQAGSTIMLPYYSSEYLD